jgi:hypothetical protein
LSVTTIRVLGYEVMRVTAIGLLRLPRVIRVMRVTTMGLLGL